MWVAAAKLARIAAQRIVRRWQMVGVEDRGKWGLDRAHSPIGLHRIFAGDATPLFVASRIEPQPPRRATATVVQFAVARTSSDPTRNDHSGSVHREDDAAASLKPVGARLWWIV